MARKTHQEVVEELENELSKIVGLEKLKSDLRLRAKSFYWDEMRRAKGMNPRPILPHMIFVGNPGTGKTTMARIYGRLLQSTGVLSTGKVVEVRSSDLVGNNVHQTALKTRRKIDQAIGGVLYVNEAHHLTTCENSKGALQEIKSNLEKGDLLVILAANTERQRLGSCVRFDDFSCDELAEITMVKMNNQDENSLEFKLHPSCTFEAIRKVIENNSSEELRSKLNGTLVDRMLAKAMENLDSRSSISVDQDLDELITLSLDDLVAGLQMLANDPRSMEVNTV